MDWSILHTLNNYFAAHDGVEDPFVAYANAAEALFLVMLVGAFLLVGGHRRTDTRRAAVAAGLSAGLALAAAQVISRIVDRPRPFVTSPHSVHVFAQHAADAGFPSDHATAAFAIGAALFLRNRVWGAVVLVAAVVLAVTRVAMGVHYPSDVLGGAVLGAVCALLLWWPPLRRPVDAIADWAGGLRDAVVTTVATRVRPAS